LLPARRERPRGCRAAEQRDEIAAFQSIELHSIPVSQRRIAGYRIRNDQSAGLESRSSKNGDAGDAYDESMRWPAAGPACDHLDSVCKGLLSTKRDDRRRRFPESYIDSAYEQHCLGTPNSGRSYARRADASRSCPRSWMSPSVGSILGEQGQQPADQCRLYTRQHRTGA
jgi:hypothetical protein